MTKKTKNLLNVVGQSKASDEAGMSRRGFLKILGSASAAVGLSACADDAKQSVFPHVKGDPSQNPGKASWYSSTCRECDAGCGIRVKTREGRAIKIEGNTESPINKGGLCAAGQAALQGLYDPDRVREPLERTLDATGKAVFTPISWAKAVSKVSKAIKDTKGEKVFFRGEETGSLKSLISEWCSQSQIEDLAWSVSSQSNLAKASKLVFGVEAIPRYDFSQAEVILSFGADFLETWISSCEYARGWSEARRKKSPVKYFHIEPRLSLTAANADKWLKNAPGSEIKILKAIIFSLISKGRGAASSVRKLKDFIGSESEKSLLDGTGLSVEQLAKIVKALSKSRKSIVVAGGTASSVSGQDLQIQILVQVLNDILANIGKTIFFDSVRQPESNLQTVLAAVEKLKKKPTENLVFLYNTNPAYSLPIETGFSYLLKSTKLVVSFSSFLDASAEHADLILPAHTTLETWGDAEPRTGVHSVIQPSMQPVFDTKSFGDILISIAKKSNQDISKSEETFDSYLKKNWEENIYPQSGSQKGFKYFWREALEMGVFEVKQSAKNSTGNVPSTELNALSGELKFDSNIKGDKESLVLFPYSSVRTFDGRFANRPWLQELPDPVTKIVWGSWIEIHPKKAKKLGIESGDLVSLDNEYGQLQAPAYITEHVHPDIAAVPLGAGQESLGRYAKQASGGNAYHLLAASMQTGNSLSFVSTKVSVSRARGSEKMVVTQGSDSQMGRDIAQAEHIKMEDTHHGHADDHHEEGHSSSHGHHEPEQMYEQREGPLFKWGMAIDLASCTGCSACVVACYAENNIPVVGKEVCDQGREMSWLRIERYYEGDGEELEVRFLPMMCQHCGNAPCEPVCPVYATYHNEEGLNSMVYNRCVGTRYCGNNCSYKVRRFNWFEYDWPEPMQWQLNPDVTKRTAGVMEKCSFCVQRINEGKNTAKNEGRLPKDGEITPACVQSCPTEALVFGNLKDPNSKVSKLASSDRSYKVLDHHLNTQPSVNYLKDKKYTI